MLEQILQSFGLDESAYHIRFFGSGLINHTFKVSGSENEFILQQINSDVFKSPKVIVNNLTLLQEYLNISHPHYLFVGPIKAVNGEFLVLSASGKYYRMFPFITGSQTINVISNEKEAYEAAKQFGRFTSLLKEFDPSHLQYTLTDFHNLELRFGQFETAEKKASVERSKEAAVEIKEVYKHNNILQTYRTILDKKEIPIRVIHHDTKISNVLFDRHQNGLCVIDLDTVMPGW